MQYLPNVFIDFAITVVIVYFSCAKPTAKLIKIFKEWCNILAYNNRFY